MGTICNALSTRVSKVNKYEHRYLKLPTCGVSRENSPPDSVNSCHSDLMLRLGTTSPQKPLAALSS